MVGLNGKVALITGAARGIGRAIAHRLAMEGADVVATDIDEQLVKKTASEVSDRGRRGVALKLDITSPTQVNDVILRIVDTVGRLDILVNNAGVVIFRDMMEITESDWDLICNVNLKGSFFVMQSVARYMIRQGTGGKIINMASTAGKHPDPFFLAYAVSKAGVICMTKGAALALGSHGINVNAVCPGPTITEMHTTLTGAFAAHHGISFEEMVAQRESKTALGRRNRPEDVAALVTFLVSEDAANITGQALNIDGGVVMT